MTAARLEERPAVGVPDHERWIQAARVFLLAARGTGHGGRCSASDCSSQNRMPISRYIVVAVVRCSWA